MRIQQDRYEIIGTLGVGASSRVDKARDSTIGRTVALKTFLNGFGSGEMQKQFLREAQIIGRLTHPSIVALYDVGTNAEGAPYLVMEYVEGKTLERTLDAGPLPLERAAVWAADLAAALARAHQCKIIHGDVKPANILITSEGHVKLGDFGIAHFATQMSGSGNVLGTPAYLSPEQILGHKQDTRSDLFSLGIILYQMTTGVRPFDGTSVGAVCAQIVSAEPVPPSHLNSALPPAFDHVVMRCLAKDPKQRYADAESLRASLYPFACGESALLAPRGQSWWQHPLQTSDLRAVAGAILVLAVLGVATRAVHEQFSIAKARARTDKHTAPRTISPNAPNASFSDASGAATSSTLINVGAVDFSGAGPNASQGTLDASNTLAGLDGRPLAASPAEAGSAAFPTALGVSSQSIPSATHAFERRVVASTNSKKTNSKTLYSAAETPAAEHSPSSRPLNSPKSAEAAAVTKSPSPLPKASLHVDIVSSIADETVSIFAGDQLLLSTQLQAAHLGDTLRFECPVSPGEHSFRVVLSRPDETVLVAKESTSQIHSDAPNFLGVHVSRRAKLFLKHEIALEVVWPSTTAPVATSVSQLPERELAFR